MLPKACWRISSSRSLKEQKEVDALSKHSITLTVNGKKRKLQVQSQETLLHALRNRLGIWGAKYGCGTGDCGVCAVTIDGAIVNSCLMLAVQARNRKIETVEGIGSAKKLHRLQEAFIREGAVQCGYCTPAMILAAKNLLDRNPNPSPAEIRQEICGILCRCTGYTKIVRAIRSAGATSRRSQ
jgi:aerobic carbon-monoxide dehydrogenase small subunit